MAKGLIWATVDDLARNRGRVLTLYRHILRSLNSPDLPLNMATRLAKKAEARAIFLVASEERSVHNIQELVDTAKYALSVLQKAPYPASERLIMIITNLLRPSFRHPNGQKWTKEVVKNEKISTTPTGRNRAKEVAENEKILRPPPHG